MIPTLKCEKQKQTYPHKNIPPKKKKKNSLSERKGQGKTPNVYISRSHSLRKFYYVHIHKENYKLTLTKYHKKKPIYPTLPFSLVPTNN